MRVRWCVVTDRATAGCAGAGISVKDEDIEQLYGEEATREAVLAGKVQPPPAATRLYAALNRLSFFASNATAP
jgi:lipid-binding SYLF domain-containing protein